MCKKGEKEKMGEMEKVNRIQNSGVRIQESEYSGFWILYSEFFPILPCSPLSPFLLILHIYIAE